MIAAKQYDMVIGVDIHLVQPPGPSPPIPIPHPFVGMVFDPMEFIPFVGADIFVNGMPAAGAGGGGVALPVHIPIGGTFIKPVDSDCEVFMGSSTVTINGSPMSFMGMPTLSCSCIGMPPPPRPKKKGGKVGLKLPTSTLLAIPAGPVVLVGGPPTVSLMDIAMKGAMMGFKFFKKTKLSKKISNKIHEAASKVTKHLPENMRNKIHKGICAVTGHPVEIATGKVFTDLVDFELPGPIPLRWERTWYSVSSYQGSLGHGWHHQYDLSLHYRAEEGNLMLRMADGRNLFFDIPRLGESIYNRQEQMTLQRQEEGFVVTDREGLCYDFDVLRVGDLQDGWSPLRRISDRAGFQVTFKHSHSGYLKSITDSAGRVLPITTDSQGRITAVQAPHPDTPGETVTLVSYTYSPDGDLIRSMDALGESFHYAYQNHLLIKETNRNGLSFQFEYDGKDVHARCLRTWGDGGIYDHQLTYFNEEKYTVVENSLGHRTEYHWNDDGQVWKTVDPLGHEQLTRYGAFSQVVSEVDELQRATHYQYDELANRTGILYPDGSTLQMAYEENQLVAATDQIGGQWAWQYNEARQLIGRADPQGHTTTYQYEEGLLSAIVDTVGGRTQLGYDQHHNLTTLTTPDGATSRWAYDALGRCTLATDPKGNRQQRRFNLQGWVRRVDEPDGNVRKLRYDAEGNVIRVTDQQHDVRFEYTSMSRLQARIEAGTRVGFHYNTEEDLTGITNEHGHVYRFELDERGDVVTESGFDGLTRRYQRDAAGQVAAVIRPGDRRTDYTYDPVGRVVGIHHHDGSQETYAYRPDGELLLAHNDHIKVGFERDELGRVLQERQAGFVLESTYNELGIRTHLQSSLGADIHFTRNAMGDVEQVQGQVNGQQGWSAQFQRDLMGLELNRQLPGGVRSEWQRDQLGRPTAHKTYTAGGRLSRTRTYTWEANDRLRQIVDGDKGTFLFEYDVFGNLSAATYPDGAREWRTPDAVGNLFRDPSQKDRKYGPAGQLLEAKGTRYEYDPEGNLVKKIQRDGSTWHYHWNAAGRLRQVVRPDGATIAFTYDALGRRISKTYRGKMTCWVWDGNVPLHEWGESGSVPAWLRQSDGSLVGMESVGVSLTGMEQGEGVRGSVGVSEQGQGVGVPHAQTQTQTLPTQTSKPNLTTWLFEPESFAPLAKLRNGQHFGIVTDHLGTPAAMYSREGEKVWEMDLSIYGKVRNLEGWREACPFRYPGQYEDVETGLYYNRFRYYDPEMGGYVSQDPIRLSSGLTQLYDFPRNPNISYDLYGLMVLYHFTSEAGLEGMNNSTKLLPSSGAKNARFGNGQYFTDISPDNIGGDTLRDLSEADIKAGKISKGQLAVVLYGDARKTKSLSHFVAIDLTGLEVEEVRPGTFLIKSDEPLDISNRIVKVGKTCGNG